MIEPFLLLLVSHILGDMVFTSHGLAVLKRDAAISKQSIGIGFHVGIHALFSGILLFLGARLWLKGALMVFIIHFLIDFTRCRVEVGLFGPGLVVVKRSDFMAWVSGVGKNRSKLRVAHLGLWFIINICDQGLHMGSLYGIAHLV